MNDDASRKESRRVTQDLPTMEQVDTIAPAKSSTDPQEFSLASQICEDTNIPALDYQDHHPAAYQDTISWNSAFIPFSSDVTIPITNPFTSFDRQILSIPNDTLLLPNSSLHYPLRNTLSSTQITYVVTQLKSFVSDFAFHSHNSFIHPLYSHNPDESLPTPFTDALSLCALHTLKSPHTFFILDSKLSNLISASERDYWSTYDWLLAVQVFILYQIIRLWSSNERQKLNAERQIPLLMQWTNQLQIEYVGLLAQGMDSKPSTGNCSEKSQIQDYHKRWVLLESIRRTVMVSFVLQCLYGGCKDGYVGELLPVLFGLPVSVGAGRAWEALGKRIHDDQRDQEDQCDINVQFGEVYTYEYWIEGWTLGIIEGGESEREIYERMLLVACPMTGASEKWGRENEAGDGEM